MFPLQVQAEFNLDFTCKNTYEISAGIPPLLTLSEWTEKNQFWAPKFKAGVIDLINVDKDSNLPEIRERGLKNFVEYFFRTS